jgi:hypothetical protein
MKNPLQRLSPFTAIAWKLCTSTQHSNTPRLALRITHPARVSAN